MIKSTLKMNMLKNHYDKVHHMIDEFILQTKDHVKNQEMADKLSSLIENIKPTKDIKTMDEMFKSATHLIYVFEFILFVMAVDKPSYESVGASTIYEEMNPGEIYTSSDELMYSIYDTIKNHPEEYKETLLSICSKIQNEPDDSIIDEIIPDNDKIFADINATMLKQDDEIITKDELPKGAKIVEINIPNTIFRTFSIRPITDMSFIKDTFGYIGTSSGLNEKIVERFNYDKIYNTDKIKDKPLITGDIEDIGDIYQCIGKYEGKNYYRKLTDFDKADPVRCYSKLGMNIFSTNMENKRLMLLKKSKKRVKPTVVTRNKMGNFKKNYYSGQSLGAAVFNEVYDDKLSDESVIRLLAYSLEYNENGAAPRDDKYFFEKIRNFTKLNSIIP